MSDEKRDYPAWLDEELFGALNTPETPAPEDGPHAGEGGERKPTGEQWPVPSSCCRMSTCPNKP